MRSPVEPPGVVVSHLHAKSERYVGSPSLAISADGAYLASHDVFGPGSPCDETLLFASHDQGSTWELRAELSGQWWSTVFFHRDALYVMGTSREYGQVVIRRSHDEGRTWTTPRDRETGVLLDDAQFHCAPVPVLSHDGRLWRAMEQYHGQTPGVDRHFSAFMMSAPAGADLLRAGSWTASNRLSRDPAVPDDEYGEWLEGNAVVTHTGEVIDMLRLNHLTGDATKAAIARVDSAGRQVTFDAARDVVAFPGGATKFTVRHDEASGCYWSIVNHVPDRHQVTLGLYARNTLAMVRSADLRAWDVRSILLQHPDDRHHGFQYVDWLADGADLVFLSRTAWDDGVSGAHNYHDANYLTFHRVPGFRELIDREARP